MANELALRDWLDERRQNALTIAASEGVSDPAAWREDADYFRRAVDAIDKRDELRALWAEWLDGMYDGPDLLRRVKLAVHGPLRKPAAVAPSEEQNTEMKVGIPSDSSEGKSDGKA
jgi:hypothetical protein